jgi:peptidyl-tRNA hydrolase
LCCGPPRIRGGLRDYVLGAMGRSERQTAAEMVVDTADAVESIITEGVSKAMSRFNRKLPPAEENSQ